MDRESGDPDWWSGDPDVFLLGATHLVSILLPESGDGDSTVRRFCTDACTE